jgi:hypothetical protein
MKEFSNDPTSEIQDISDVFHRKIILMQQDLVVVKKLVEQNLEV